MNDNFELNKNGETININISDMVKITEYYHKLNIYDFLTTNYSLSKNGKDLTENEINRLVEDIYHERYDNDAEDTLEIDIMEEQNIEYRPKEYDKLKTIQQILEDKNKINTEFLKLLVKDLNICELNFDKNKISLDPNDIHYNESEKEFLFQRKENIDKDFYYEVSKLLIKVLRYIDPNDKQALSLGYALFVASSKDDYKIDDLVYICNNPGLQNIQELANNQINDILKVEDKHNNNFLLYDIKTKEILPVKWNGEDETYPLPIDEKNKERDVIILKAEDISDKKSIREFNNQNAGKNQVLSEMLKGYKINCIDTLLVKPQEISNLKKDYIKNTAKCYSVNYKYTYNLKQHLNVLEINNNLKKSQNINLNTQSKKENYILK